MLAMTIGQARYRPGNCVSCRISGRGSVWNRRHGHGVCYIFSFEDPGSYFSKATIVLRRKTVGGVMRKGERGSSRDSDSYIRDRGTIEKGVGRMR